MTEEAILAVRLNDAWVNQVGSYFQPLKIRDGASWIVFAGGPGPGQLKVRDASGAWVLLATEGYQFAQMSGHVVSGGLPAANRTVYFHQDFATGTVVGSVDTDASGNFEYKFLPFNKDIYVRVFYYPNNFNYANSTVRGTFRFTQAFPTDSLVVGF